MTVVELLGYVGSIINDVVSILSLIGSLILLLGSFGKATIKKYGKIAEWSIMGLVFGWGLQIAMEVSNTMPEKVGFIFPISPLMVYALLGASSLMLIGRWLIRRLIYPNASSEKSK